jgi:hypothetical protein
LQLPAVTVTTVTAYVLVTASPRHATPQVTNVLLHEYAISYQHFTRIQLTLHGVSFRYDRCHPTGHECAAA